MKRISLIFGLFFIAICSFGQMKIISGDVNFRTSPEIKDNKICIIPKGTLVSVVQDSTEYFNWTKIDYEGKKGFVNNSYLKDVTGNSKNYSYDSSATHQKAKYYKNSKGEKVQSPTISITIPEGATAECNDGTYSFSKSRRGTCSHHGGVKRWLK